MPGSSPLFKWHLKSGQNGPDGDLNNGPFNDWTAFDHSNNRRVCYSDPHCITKNPKILVTSLKVRVTKFMLPHAGFRYNLD